MGLRNYQHKMIEDGRNAIRNGAKRICMQAPTGAGKTVVFTEITRLLLSNNFRTWISVPRKELLRQASDELSAAGVPHGRIDSKNKESSAFKVHVVSKDTLIRRYDSIKNPPDWLIPDECHIALDRYIEIWEKLKKPNMIGFSATPERGDGRGLSELYQVMVPGPPLAYLVELGFLSEPEYYCPPLEGLNKVGRVGSEYKSKALAQLLEERKIYGKSIEHYEKHAKGLPAIVFTRSVKDAEKTAHQYRAAGYAFESIDGNMTVGQRLELIDGLKSNQLQGLVSCDLLTYGVDIPNVSCISLLRPTLSKALHYQMIGRGLRWALGKSSCKIFDHVNNYLTHGHPLVPYEWRFNGTEKRITEPGDTEAISRLCPELDFLYCVKKTCAGCPHDKSGTSRQQKRMQVVAAELEKVNSPVKLKERPPIEKAVYQDRILRAVDSYLKNPNQTGPIAELMKIAEENKFKPLWVYWKLSEGRYSVNVPLLHEMRRLGNYHSFWPRKMQEFISRKLRSERTR